VGNRSSQKEKQMKEKKEKNGAHLKGEEQMQKDTGLHNKIN